MMAHKDQRDTNLSSIRMLIVADGANPCESLLPHKHVLFAMRNYYTKTCFWLFLHLFGNILNLHLFSGSVSSCDAFLNVFQSHGLKPEVICPCATSPEALTVAIRRYHICILTCCGKRHSNKCSFVLQTTRVVTLSLVITLHNITLYSVQVKNDDRVLLYESTQK